MPGLQGAWWPLTLVCHQRRVQAQPADAHRPPLLVVPPLGPGPAALQSLNPTITQVRNQLASLYPSGGSSEAASKAAPAGAGTNGAAPLSRAAAVTAQAEAAAREVNVSRRQADAQRWIANWRSRSRGNLKAVAAAMAADQQRQQQQALVGLDSDRLTQVGEGPGLRGWCFCRWRGPANLGPPGPPHCHLQRPAQPRHR